MSSSYTTLYFKKSQLQQFKVLCLVKNCHVTPKLQIKLELQYKLKFIIGAASLNKKNKNRAHKQQRKKRTSIKTYNSPVLISEQSSYATLEFAESRSCNEYKALCFVTLISQ